MYDNFQFNNTVKDIITQYINITNIFMNNYKIIIYKFILINFFFHDKLEYRNCGKKRKRNFSLNKPDQKTVNITDA